MSHRDDDGAPDYSDSPHDADDSGDEGIEANDFELPLPHRWRRRGWLGVLGVAGAAAVALFAIPGARDKLPASVAVVGRDAGTVFDQSTRAGLPITDGVPGSPDFRDMVRNNGCKSSRSFVRTDTAETGWGFICVRPPDGAYRRVSGAFEEIPMLVGPLYVDDGDGEVIVFGFGWPADASKLVYDAMGASGGTYLVEQ